MSRRKHLAVRSPCGRISRSANPELMSPAEVHRLVSAAQAGLRDPVWSSEIGRLHLQGKITSSQFAAAKRWSALVAAYSDACCSPRPPQTMSLDAAGGTSADPDSATGIRMSERLKAIWKAAPRCALPARQPSALSTAFVCRIVRRPAFMNSMLCVRD